MKLLKTKYFLIFLFFYFSSYTSNLNLKTPQVIEKGESLIPFIIYDVKHKQADQPPVIAVTMDMPAYSNE